MKISKTPSVRTFTDAWTQELEAVVHDAAGKDGRLSAREAARIADRFDQGRHFADNAVNYLNAKGQKSVSPSKLTETGRRYVEDAARKSAGPDGRISRQDQAKLPVDLRSDIAALQGSDVSANLARLTSGMTNISETDSPVLSFVVGQVGGAAISPELVAKRVGSLYEQHKLALGGGTRSVDVGPLKTQPVTVADANGFLARRGHLWDVGDPSADSYAGRWRALGEFMRANLTDLKMFRFGTIEATYALVGRTAAGELAGIMTGAVET